MRVLLFLCTLAACGGGDSPDSGDAASTGATGCQALLGEVPLCTAWRINTTEVAAVLQSTDQAAPLTEVQSVAASTDGQTVSIATEGIPAYQTLVTAELLEALNARPKAATDFRDGSPAVEEGDLVDFGADIGFSSNSTCPTGGGFGYWPPGPECPAPIGASYSFPAAPEPATTPCETGLDAIGVWVNGVAMFNWSDGQSYQGEGSWLILAPVAESYDVDICGGHAAGDTYHHHSPPGCLEELLEDEGTEHSPVYGFAADGYPLHGPWYAAGESAASCWKARDYDDPDSATGCGVAGVRSCQLVDATDPSQGTVEVSAGPDTDAEITSLSGNVFIASSGYFYQDWWFDSDCAAAGGAALDEHNGHEHGELGYHYHLSSSFPYTVGPRLRGEVPADSFTSCDGVQARGGPGGP